MTGKLDNDLNQVLFCPEKLGPLGQVRDRWLCLGVLCLKSQIPSTKLQINLKFQYSMTKTFQDEILFGISNFGHWKLFDICDLIFVIFELPTNQIPSGDKTKPGPLGQDSLLFDTSRRRNGELFF
ncbi:MAG: hypothetical protein JRD01_04075 [Deltaproteobacteria bacterium]|nr:hypothetical protein [Deltaproteobacteria bacterium]